MYRAIRACFHAGHYFRVGERYSPSNDELKNEAVPRHFVKSGKFSDDAVDEAAREEKMKRIKVRTKRAEPEEK
jgi:hypothetical protein